MMIVITHISQNTRVSSDDQTQSAQSLCPHEDSSSIQRNEDHIQNGIECVAKTLSRSQLFGKKINTRRVLLGPEKTLRT
jgi:hypothetical protein